ncbi:MAG TPA: YtxH domain-containing protein [Chromatiales bacterium]|nr:YtxH domain-containing protein [Chromatiales bacterium]HEX22834.1 YtxH domain-containing protein [Chromatiales bacterium]
MGKFVWGLILGAVLAFPAGMNIGQGKPLFSNPLESKPLSTKMRDSAKRAMDTARDKAKQAMESTKEAASIMVDKTKEVVDDAREAVQGVTGREETPAAEAPAYGGTKAEGQKETPTP